jgi:dTDP-4-dehydrorhamnose reductase
MILITGSGGQLGQSLRQLAPQFPDLELIFMNSGQLDITDRQAVIRFFEDHQLTACINCAAYTAVDKAESEPELARSVNVLGTQYLAEGCSLRQIPFIHFSSDYVYHNNLNRPLIETDRVQPKGVYARTKLYGEREAFRRHQMSMVIRTSWVYAPFGHNFVLTMKRLGAERPELNVVFDQIGAPTFAPDLAQAVLGILRQVHTGQSKPETLAGIWHYANEGVTSWYDFACRIMSICDLPCKINPILSAQYPTPAQRPHFSVLNKAKIKHTFGLEIPHWADSLKVCLSQLE